MTRDQSARLVRALTEHRALSMRQLEEQGFSRSTVRRYMDDGLLRRVARGIVALQIDDDPWRTECVAALATFESGVLSHQSAAQLLSIPFHDRRVHVTVPSSTRAKGDVVVHRSTDLAPEHRRVVGGLRCTSFLRTLFDLATTSPDDNHYYWLLEQAIANERTTLAGLLRGFDALASRGRPGSTRRQFALHKLLDDEPVATDSELEKCFAALAGAHGIEGLRFHFRPPWFDGVRGVVDAAIPSAKLIIELDGRRWHATQQDFARDRERDRRAVEAGWRVLRFTHGDVTKRPQSVVDSIRRAIGDPAEGTCDGLRQL